jgi:hypothetical protein
MNHLEDGQLRAYLDGELEEASIQHLDDCPECQRRLSEVRALAGQMEKRLAFLNPSDSHAAGRTASQALLKFNNLVKAEKEVPPMKRMLYPKYRPIWAGLAAILVIAIALSFPSVRAWAGEFLGVFRVRQVTVIPIDTTGLSSLTGHSTLGNQISQMLSTSIKVNQEPGNPETAVDAADASQKAGFQVRLPTNQVTSPQLTVQGGTAFTIAVDRARAQALLDESGHSDLQLPASLDGATIDVKIPAAVSAGYGTCPAPTEAEADNSINSQGSPGRRYADCVMLVQIPSPTINTPPDVDLAKLAEIGLEFTGMSPAEAQSFTQNVDWTSSLVIPIPRNAATYKEVDVDGVTGTLIQRPADDAPEYALVWVKDGIIYAIGGLGSDSAQAIDMANSLN